NRARAANRSDVAEIGTHAGTISANPMARAAGAFAVEDRPAARGIAPFHRGGVESVHVTEIGDDARHVGIVERERRAARGPRGGSGEPRHGGIGDRVAEFSAAQVDPADRIALRAMTGDTSRRIEGGAMRDIHVWI